jgi:hypothetical protein
MYDDYEPEYYNPEDFLEEYEVSLREVIAKAVNTKIKNSLEKLEEYKEKYEKQSDEIRDLKRQINVANTDYEKKLKEALRENRKEIQKELSTGFAVNDSVWYIDSKSTMHTCDKCNGNYNIEVEVLGKKTNVKCPHCDYGRVYTHEYFPKEDTISSLQFYISRTDRNNKNSEVILKTDWGIKVWLDKLDSDMKTESLYKSYEECLKVCEEKNKKSVEN